jgi:membrane fusion protein (multidrug efflux system)
LGFVEESEMNGRRKILISAAIGLAIILLLFLIVRPKENNAAQATARPMEVEVVPVEQRDVPIYSEWIGTLDGTVNADIKSQVTGYLLSRNYTEGSFVKKGQLLFEIDPRPFEAALEQAKGELAKARGQLAQANSQLPQARAQLAQAIANKQKAQLDVDRYAPLAREKAVTQQDLDNAVQANLVSQAQVEASTAGVETAKAAIVAATAAVQAAEANVKAAELNLGFTKIISPIDGIAGIATVQVGNLVNPNNPNSPALTTVSTVDPIKVYFTASEQEYLSYIRDGLLNGKSVPSPQKVELDLILADGTTFPHKGTFHAADRNVDEKTGSIKLTGLFPNPGNALRPGEYARIRAITTVKKDATVIPQRAVSEIQGSYRVAVVGSDNKVELRPVKVGERVGTDWIIEEGLKPGEYVIAEGIQRVRPGVEVAPKPYSASGTPAAP